MTSDKMGRQSTPLGDERAFSGLWTSESHRENYPSQGSFEAEFRFRILNCFRTRADTELTAGGNLGTHEACPRYGHITQELGATGIPSRGREPLGRDLFCSHPTAIFRGWRAAS